MSCHFGINKLLELGTRETHLYVHMGSPENV